MQQDLARASLAAQYEREMEFILARHAARQKELARLAAPSYLRAALGCVRELATLTRFDPRLVTAAQALLASLTTATREAEERCFAAGGNSAPYLSLLVQLETMRIRLMVLQVRIEQQQAQRPPTAAPATPKTSDPSVAVTARRYVPPNQGGRHR